MRELSAALLRAQVFAKRVDACECEELGQLRRNVEDCAWYDRRRPSRVFTHGGALQCGETLV